MADRILELADEILAESRLRRDPIWIAGRRLWAAIMLTRRLDVCEAILGRHPVIAFRLDAVVLGHALRGGRLPDPDSYVLVTDEMLDAVAEAGPFEPKRRRR